MNVLGQGSFIKVTLLLTFEFIFILNIINNPDFHYIGKKNMAATNKDLKKLPSGGRTGKWKFSVSQGGFMTAKNYLEVLADIDQYLTDNEIERPVVVFIDGYPGKFDC